jgi:transcriptional regulator with AAA-type ATPase domain
MSGEQDTSLEQALMNANIREFGHTISLICALESGGKITPDEAYRLIKKTWQELKLSRKSLLDGDKKP